MILSYPVSTAVQKPSRGICPLKGRLDDTAMQGRSLRLIWQVALEATVRFNGQLDFDRR